MSRRWEAASRWGLRERRVGGTEPVRDGRSHRVEPPAAPGGVEPALGELALGVVAHEQVVGPLLIRERVGVRRVVDVRLPAVAELDLITRPAPWAGDQQHVRPALRRTLRRAPAARSYARP